MDFNTESHRRSLEVLVGWALPTVNSRDWSYLVGKAHPTKNICSATLEPIESVKGN